MTRVTELFGTMVFSDSEMKKRLPSEVYEALMSTAKTGNRLKPELAQSVAAAMRDWAVEKGATHYTHWFQPLTGVTAEKHDSFITPNGKGGVIMEFSGKELIHGEPDASSFPSGGLRATFEARGYTAWDPTSFAFVKDDVLYIPTAFCSYGGEALDKKTPLLRSMQAINKQAKRVLKLFGTEAETVKPMVGAEQEYFLVERAMYDKREDLIYTGRTLFGMKPPKTQEMDDHYFGTLKPRVAAYMRELDVELWKLGVMAKTEHNEVAPAQHELACIYDTANIAADHNQLVMEIMQKTAKRLDLVCLLHEKPFLGVNGSGKHNNWSLATDKGVNLLEPGDTPGENAQFLLFLCAVLKAADEYQDLLRISIASAGNDHRLGAAEAPPAIVSLFIGTELEDILEAIVSDSPMSVKEKEMFKVGVHALPPFPKDTTDRNRTSPFAFTGNKFEFRMPGSAASVSDANTFINTSVAESLRKFADELENAEDFEKSLQQLIKRTISEHKRIIFNGNGYSADWTKEAEERGLLNLSGTPDCLHHLVSEKNVELFTRHGVFSGTELHSRLEIAREEYCKLICIEASTMLNMARREVFPAVSTYVAKLLSTAAALKDILPQAPRAFEAETAENLALLSDAAYGLTKTLDKLMSDIEHLADLETKCKFLRDKVLPVMGALRAACDDMESITESSVWPFPGYGELLFGVK